MATPSGHGKLSDDPSGELRRYAGAFMAFCGIAPLLMFAGLAAKIGEPDFPMMPVLIAAPLIVAGVAVTVTGIAAKDPKRSVVRIGTGAALIVVGDSAIFGVRALLVQ